MSISRPTLRKTLLLAASLLITGAAHAQTVLYRETFGATTDQTTLSTAGWQSFIGSASLNATTPQNFNSSMSNQIGRPTDLGNINAGASLSSVNGLAYGSSVNGAENYLFFTDEFALNRSAFTINSFSWFAGSRYGGDSHRLAVRIGTNWFAANTALIPVAIGAASNFATQSQQMTFNFNTGASNWRTLNFAPGQPMTLGSVLTNDLPTGNISAFGLYAVLGDQPGATDEVTRFDTFTVNATAVTVVPEPGTAALLLLPAVAMLVGTRLRRRRA
jgi:hypothetical protein